MSEVEKNVNVYTLWGLSMPELGLLANFSAHHSSQLPRRIGI